MALLCIAAVLDVYIHMPLTQLGLCQRCGAAVTQWGGPQRELLFPVPLSEELVCDPVCPLQVCLPWLAGVRDVGCVQQKTQHVGAMLSRESRCTVRERKQVQEHYHSNGLV